MLFPFISNETLEIEELDYNPREYGINYETGQLTGKIVEGYEAVLVWAWLALQSARYRYYIYSWDYGQEYESMIGKGYSKEYIDAELYRMTEECLTMNPYITGIDNFECKKDGDHVTLSFSLLTTFGNGEVSVSV